MVKLPLKNRIDILFLIVFVVLINIFYINYRGNDSVNQSSRMVAHANEALFNLEGVISNVSGMESRLKSYIMTGKQEYLDPLPEMSGRIAHSLNQLKNLLYESPDQSAKVDSLSVLITQKKKQIAEMVSAFRAGERDSALKHVSSDRAKAGMDQIAMLAASIRDEQLNLLSQRIREHERLLKRSNRYYILLSTIVVALLGLFYVMVRNSSTRLLKVNNKLTMANDELKASEDELRRNLDQISHLQQFLQEREKQYRDLVENAMDMIYEVDERGRFSFTNSQLQDLSGYTQHELLQMTYLDLVAPEYKESVIQFYRQQVLERKLTTYFEFPMISKTGHEIWVGQNVRMIFREDGWVVKVHVVARDISQLKHVRQKLEESEKYYRLLATNSRDMITLFKADEKATRIFVSPSVKEILGYEPEELIGKSPFDLIIPEDLARMKQEIHPMTLSGKPAHVEYRIRRKDGTIIWMESNSHPFFDNEGNMTGFQTSARDITQRKQFEFELIAAKEKAVEATKAKSHFLSTMSHEIRTPMNAIIGLTNWLLQGNPRPDQAESLKLLKFSGENLLTIINDILDFSKIEAGKLTLESSSFYLHELMRNIASMLEQRAVDKGISLRFAYDEKLPKVVMGDTVRLTQIITNLLGNAIKFTEQGYVEMSVRSGGIENGKHSILVKIKDTGIGIPEDKLKYIFEGFSQVHSSSKFGGTGLGLSISKKLLNLMESDIEVDSKPGFGSTFFFTVRLPEGMLNDVVSATIGINPSGPEHLAIRVLLVDDNEVNQIVATNFLQKWGMTIDKAYDGREAIELVKSKLYQVVLMDLHMPQVSGYQASAIIRSMEDPYFKTLPIIALSASATTDVREKVLEAGMNDYVSKPFQPQELYARIRQHILAPPQALHAPVERQGMPAPVARVAIEAHTDMYVYFDRHQFNEHTMGLVEVKKETAEAFLKLTPQLLEDIQDAIAVTDKDKVRNQIHKLKSSVSIFCKEDFASFVASLEHDAQLTGEKSYDYKVNAMVSDVRKLMAEVALFNKTL